MPSRRDTFRRAETGLRAWIDRFAHRTLALGRRCRGTPVAITEPVFDDVLHAASLSIVTRASFSKAIENGNDPSPQDVATMRTLLGERRVAALVYNRHTVEASTSRLLALTRASRVPVVAVTKRFRGANGMRFLRRRVRVSAFRYRSRSVPHQQQSEACARASERRDFQ